MVMAMMVVITKTEHRVEVQTLPPPRPFDHISADNLGHAEHSYFHASGFILELDYLSYSSVQLNMS